jgi:hypothetical protein
MELNKSQAEQIIRNQQMILDKLEKLVTLLAPRTLKLINNEVLNLSEAAYLLNVSSSILSEACLNREVPCRKVGSTYIFLREALLEWIKSNEVKIEIKESIDSEVAAQLIGVSTQKIRYWSKAHQYYKIPVIQEGRRFFYDRELLLQWAEGPEGKALIEGYKQNVALIEQRAREAEKLREAERLEAEARKKERLEKKMAKLKNVECQK